VVDNTVRDHRLRMMAEAGFKAEKSIASCQFDVIERPVHLEDTSHWDEVWTGTNPVCGAHGAGNDKRGIAVLSFGLTEFEVIDDEVGTIATTLMRTFQYPKMSGLMREDRVKRIGNEDSQMLGEQTFRYAFCFYKGAWDRSNLMKQMYDFKYPVAPTQHGRHEGSLFGKKQAFFRLEPDDLCLAALKKTEYGNNVIARFYNPTEKEIQGKLWCYYEIKEARATEIDESRVGKLAVTNGHEIALRVPKKKIVTLELALVPLKSRPAKRGGAKTRASSSANS